MSTTDTYYPPSRPDLRRSWLGRAEDWLDEKGRVAWIVAAVAGFAVFWPVGLAILAYMIWGKRMFFRSHEAGSRWGSRGVACGSRRDRMEAWHTARAAMRPSGNVTFDAYKAETLRRLEDEQRAFEDFLGRLRAAKDKAEFDQFMEDRARRATDASEGEGSQDAA